MTETQTPAADTAMVTLTEAALAKVTALLAKEDSDLALRIGVQAGGCAGLRYQLYFDDESSDDDIETTIGDVRILIDRLSAPYLIGATIDFADTIERQGFTIDNPNAHGTCGCGDSFNC